MVTKLQRSDSVDRIAELLGPDASTITGLHFADDPQRAIAPSRSGLCRSRYERFRSLGVRYAFAANAV